MAVSPILLKRSKDWLEKLFDCKSNISRKKVLLNSNFHNTCTLLGIITDVVRGRIPLEESATPTGKKRLAKQKTYLRELVSQKSQLRKKSK
jgi:hypothetical protein